MMTEIEGAAAFADLWGQLSPLQRRFVVAMQEHPTKKEAALAIEISPNTVYNWPSTVDETIAFMTNNIALATLGILQANATKAAMVKAAGLDSGDEKIRQDVATEILDRNLGKPKQSTDITSKGESIAPITYIVENRPPETSDD